MHAWKRVGIAILVQPMAQQTCAYQLEREASCDFGIPRARVLLYGSGAHTGSPHVAPTVVSVTHPRGVLILRSTRCHPEWQQRWVPIWIWVRVRSTLWRAGMSDSCKVVGEAALWNCRVDAGREIRWRWSGTSSCPLACLTPDETVASLSICDPSEKHDEPFQARSRCHEEVSAASTGRWSAAAPGVETSDCLKRMR